MNKKGFTLVEVIISIVLVSTVLTAMLASLVKLKSSYEVVSGNTDALVFSSSLSRIINNDFEQNGGIRYIDCTYYGDYCDITLNNDQKRKLEIKTVQVGSTWHEQYNQFKKLNSGKSNYKSLQNKFLKNVVVKVTNNGTETFYSLADFYKDGVGTEIAGYRASVEEAFENQYCEIMDSGVDSYLSGMCTIAIGASGSQTSCDCTKQLLSTSLSYSDVTSGNKKNIYVKTLSLTKEKDLYIKQGDGSYIDGTGKVRTNGYNFGKLSFTNIFYDNTSRGTGYKDSVSLISIEINDGINVLDTSFNINLSSTSTYLASATQVGKLICFNFDNFGKNNEVSNVSQLIDNFCIRYGVSFSVKKDDYHTKISKFNVSSCSSNYLDNKVTNPQNLTDVCQAPFIPKANPEYVFNGYYFNYDNDNDPATDPQVIEVIDKNGDIKITTTFFETSLANQNPILYADWVLK